MTHFSPSLPLASPQLNNIYPSSRRVTTVGRVAASSPKDPAAAHRAHNAAQAEYFTRELGTLTASLTPEVEAQLAAVAAAVPDLGPASRVLDVGAGDGALIPHLQRRGVLDILAVDVCPAMLDALRVRLGEPSPLGNEPAVRPWLGDVAEVPPFQGPFDAAFFNAVFGNVLDQQEALLQTCFLLRPGSAVVISHPMGRQWLERYRAENPAIVPNPLPSERELRALIADLPLRLERFEDGEDLYLAVLRVPEGYAHLAAPLCLSGPVVPGFGRGSKQLGVPTANLPPGPLAEQLKNLSTGVYFGWARLDPAPGAPEQDAAVHKMVMNVGRRPTFQDAEPELSVELHILHPFAEDFYGRPLKAVVLGYLRPEIRFSGLPELLGRIHTDIGVARTQLDLPAWAEFRADPFFDE